MTASAQFLQWLVLPAIALSAIGLITLLYLAFKDIRNKSLW